MSDETLRNYLRAAVIEHLRWWLADDGVNFRNFQTNGQVDPKTLRTIAVIYYVSRGLRKGKQDRIAKLIDRKLEDWPEKLTERASFVSDIANLANKQGLTNGVQLSAFSKLLWFARPDGWTLYDKWAQKGLAHPRKSIGFIAYYKRLEELQFLEVTGAMRDVINGSHFDELWPERIVDKYLMMCGQQSENSNSTDGAPEDGFIAPSTHDDYLEVLEQFVGPEFLKNVEALTDGLMEVVADKKLFQVHRR